MARSSRQAARRPPPRSLPGRQPHPRNQNFNYDLFRKIVCCASLLRFLKKIKNLLEMMPRQALHARVLGFYHPHSNEKMHFEAELPEDMKKVLEEMR